MGILIGMDEAGYGPNLGPLVIAATAWHIDDASIPESDGEVAAATNGIASANRTSHNETSTALLTRPKRKKPKPQLAEHLDLYRRLRNIVAKSPSERRVPIADSKVLYNPAAGLRQLERGLHSVLLAMQEQHACWSSIVNYCQADPDAHYRRVCWPDGFDCALPTHAAQDELARLGTRFARACNAAGVRPLVIRAKLVFPEQFNDLLAHYGNKATVLSHITVGLLREVIDLICLPASDLSHPPSAAGSPPSALSPPPSIHAVCDKHGGRNFYTALLQHHFSEHWISPVFESHAESHYEWGADEARVRAVFRINGEAFLPTALASMTAKYLRELAMKAFNEFWSARVPDLRPTAGYYGDSRRFKRAIESKQRELKIDDHLIWRSR
jgi:hypothetical protein